jgi:DNA-binding transcriptional ArsR family regulator
MARDTAIARVDDAHNGGSRASGDGDTPGEGTIATARLLDGVDRVVPTVEFGELASLLTMLIDSLGGAPFGAPTGLRKAAVSKLESRDIRALRPFVKTPPDQLPSCLCILSHRTRTGFSDPREDLERIATIPPEQLATQLPPDPRWDGVRRNPRAWLYAFVRAVQRARSGFREPWASAAGLFDREAERIGAAAVRGTEAELFATRLPPVVWRLEGPTPHGAKLETRLGIAPLLAGPGSAHALFIDGKLSHVVYPVADLWRLVDAEAPPPAALESLLGVQRALILRRLDRPMTAGTIAEALMAVPSAATHHVAILERAGLVRRERQGRSMIVHRTARGTQVLALYE